MSVDGNFDYSADKYKDRIMEFDACILNVVNHDNYDTRYNILLSAGNDVNENIANSETSFKFIFYCFFSIFSKNSTYMIWGSQRLL